MEHLRKSAELGVVAISSPGDGDGKTTTAINLAGALAQAPDARVLLIDADLRRSAVLGRLGLPDDAPGVVDLVQDRQLRLEDVVRPLPGLNFSVLPAGRHTATPYEVLKSPAVADLLAEARRRYDYVILDTPPVVPVPDCRILEKLVDGVLLVVGANRTPRRMVEEALSLLDAAKLVGHRVQQGRALALELLRGVRARRLPERPGRLVGAGPPGRASAAPPRSLSPEVHRGTHARRHRGSDPLRRGLGRDPRLGPADGHRLGRHRRRPRAGAGAVGVLHRRLLLQRPLRPARRPDLRRLRGPPPPGVRRGLHPAGRLLHGLSGHPHRRRRLLLELPPDRRGPPAHPGRLLLGDAEPAVPGARPDPGLEPPRRPDRGRDRGAAALPAAGGRGRARGRRRRRGAARLRRVRSHRAARQDHRRGPAGSDRRRPGRAPRAPPRPRAAGCPPRRRDRRGRAGRLRAARRQARDRGADAEQPRLLAGLPEVPAGPPGGPGAEPGRRAHRPAGLPGALPAHRAGHPARLARPRPLRPGPDRAQRAPLPAAQVPHDAAGRRRAPPSGSATTPAASRGSASSSGATASTSCPSSSTCSGAT